jgi:hypothetical protein
MFELLIREHENDLQTRALDFLYFLPSNITVFADAGYWIALFNPRDQLHAKAISISTTLQGRSIVTSQMVLTEFLNHYAALEQPFRQRAAQVVRCL